MPSDGGTHQSPTSPLCSTVGTHERLAFYLQAKYEVVYATKVVGEHSHPNFRPPGQPCVYFLDVDEKCLSCVTLGLV